MEYSREDLKNAYKAGVFDSQMDSHIVDDIDNAFDEYLSRLEKTVEEPMLKIYYVWIKYNCGWSKFCDITGGNHYAINEFGEFDDNDSFDISLSQAERLGYVRH